jgi:hypothetical protein
MRLAVPRRDEKQVAALVWNGRLRDARESTPLD